jgi:enamine deaminase RidA (YjgF/YER057c/UK114 family)
MYLRFDFDQPTSAMPCENALSLALPNKKIAGAGFEQWLLPGPGRFVEEGAFTVWLGSDIACGAAVLEVDDRSIERTAYELYRGMLRICEGYELQRIWNFVPDINHPVGELDRYMCFCRGRADALSTHSNPIVNSRLPPASAVGTNGDHLCVAFLAGPTAIEPVENPLQTPAYNYPSRYGPASPSFARAGLGNSREVLYVSGTASIRKSESLHVNNFRQQAITAVENIVAVSRNANFADWLHSTQGYDRTVRVYVKNAEVWDEHAHWFAQNALVDTEQFNVIQADICRPELLIEIEATVRKRSNHSI